MPLPKSLLLIAAIVVGSVPCLADDKYDSALPPPQTPRGVPLHEHQDFGYAPSYGWRPMPVPVPHPYMPRLGPQISPTVDYYHHPYVYYPAYGAPYHLSGPPVQYRDARYHSPYRFESQGGVLDYGYYPDHRTYYVGPRDWGGFFRTHTDADNVRGPKKDVIY